MKKTSNNELIKKIDEYIENNHPMMEIQIIDAHDKLRITRNEFGLSLANLKECSIIEKYYVGFQVLEIKDEHQVTIGLRLITNHYQVYQITSLSEISVAGSIKQVDTYKMVNVEANKEEYLDVMKENIYRILDFDDIKIYRK